MKVVYAIPISRGIAKEELSYFSSEDIPAGSLIYAPLRGKEVPAIVTALEDPQNIKARLRTADFKLRKISPQKGQKILSPHFIEAAKRLAYENASATGAVLHSLVPRAVLETPQEISEISNSEYENEKKPHSKTVNEKYILQNTSEKRAEELRNCIRNFFAKNSSVMLCAPTIKEAERLYEALKKGIEDCSFLLHSGQTKKQQKNIWNEAVSRQGPTFCVVTGGFISLPLFNLATMIIENENSPFYTVNQRPHLDIRDSMENIAKFYKARIIFSGFPTRVSTFYRYKNDELEPLESPLLRLKDKPETEIVDMRPEKTEGTTAKEQFRVLSDNLIDLIKETTAQNKRVFIFAPRRGLSPITVCQDCGTLVACEKCEAPVVLHKGEKEEYNRFICHKCGSERSALEKCAGCNSWKLKDLGIGIQKTAEALEEQFPDHKILRLDRESGSTHKKAQKIADEFYSSPGSILVGTEMSISFLDYEVSLAGIASLDSLLSLPEYRAQERVFSMLARIQENTQDHLVVQTRSPDNELLKICTEGDFSGLYRSEMQIREGLGYPPFAKLIKITCSERPDKVENKTEKVLKALSDYGPKKYSPISSTAPKGQKRINILLKTSPEKWPDEDLLSILRSLPMNCAVNIDPENLLD